MLLLATGRGELEGQADLQQLPQECFQFAHSENEGFKHQAAREVSTSGGTERLRESLYSEPWRNTARLHSLVMPHVKVESQATLSLHFISLYHEIL